MAMIRMAINDATGSILFNHTGSGTPGLDGVTGARTLPAYQITTAASRSADP